MEEGFINLRHEKRKATTLSGLVLPLAEKGLYKATDILSINGFPYGKTWLYENSTPDGDFVVPVVHQDRRLYKGRDVNEWFEKIGSNYMNFSTGNPC